MKYGVVLVHYRNYPDVVEALRQLLRQSVRPALVVVVDNSPDDLRFRDSLPADDNIVYIPSDNCGYGAAMNVGMRALFQASDVEAAFLVTHELRTREDTVERLLQALDREPGLGLVGPAIGRLGDEHHLWSAGGRLSGLRLKASHDLNSQLITELRAGGVEYCDWIDGCALLIRREAAVLSCGFDENFFLYWEEVDLAIRLRAQGMGVACDRGAIAWQRPKGTPTYLECRNRLILLRKYGGLGAVLAEVIVAVVSVLRACLGVALRRRPWRDVPPRFFGVVDGLSGRLRGELL